MNSELIEEFIKSLPIIIKDIVSNPEFSDMEEINRDLEAYLKSNASFSWRGPLFVKSSHALLSPQQFEKLKFKIFTIGWCIELLENSLSLTERYVIGTEPLFFNGPSCFNYTLLINGSLYNILFKLKFPEIVKLFREAHFKRAIVSSALQDASENFQISPQITEYKSILNFFLPLASSFVLAKKKFESSQQDILRKICKNFEILHNATSEKMQINSQEIKIENEHEILALSTTFSSQFCDLLQWINKTNDINQLTSIQTKQQSEYKESNYLNAPLN